MLTSMFNIPIPSATLEQALSDIIKSIAVEENALSNILNLEREMLEKTKTGTRNLEEFISVNESINSTIKNVIKLQTLLQIKLEHVEDLFQKIEDFDESDELEE